MVNPFIKVGIIDYSYSVGLDYPEGHYFVISKIHNSLNNSGEFSIMLGELSVLHQLFSPGMFINEVDLGIISKYASTKRFKYEKNKES